MSDTVTAPSQMAFADLGLPENMLATLEARGYLTPSPIQVQTIPPLLQGKDVLGMAQTGTGKTAAFSLPLLANVDPDLAATQILILAPTRELAIQVAESCSAYGKSIHGLRVSCLYGGSSYVPQLQQLKRGAHVVVGTPVASSTTSTAAPWCSTISRPWCSTKPMKCCAWALSTTSPASPKPAPKSVKPPFSRPPCPQPSPNLRGSKPATPWKSALRPTTARPR